MPITETFSTPGTYFWTCPNNVALADSIFAVGGGGRGGFRSGTTAGGGGGGAASAKSLNVTLVPGAVYVIFIPNGRGTTAFYKNSGPLSYMLFAAPGNNAVNSAAGSGGLASDCIGQQRFNGGNGYSGTIGSGGGVGGSGGGGSSGGSAANGNSASGGGGAVAPTDGGNGGNGNNGAGSNGVAPGGGGGGTNLTTDSGGVEGNGKFVITYSEGTAFFTITGSSTVSNPGAALAESPFVITGSSTVSNPGNVNRTSAFTITAGATVSNPGAQKVASAFSIIAGATVSNPGAALVKSAFVITGSSSMVMVGASDGSSSFSIVSSSSMNMVGAALVESSFEIQGSSFVDMKSPQVISSAFVIAGSSVVRMYSPNLQVSTLQNGSGGNPNDGATIDWTLCDFANIELTAGVGSYPVDHVNLIAGKKISVHVHNNSNATGVILWDGGDAPISWIGLPAPPAMPANGETLHVEFECNKDRTEIFGRLFVDESIRGTLDGLDRRYGRALFDHSTNAGNVSTGETTLFSDIIIGGTLAQNGDKVLAEYAVEFAMSLNAKQILVYFPNAVSIFDTGSLAITATTDCELRVLLIRKTASTARAIVTITTLPVTVGGGNAQITDEAALSGLNFDLDNILKLTAIGGASDDVIAKLGFGEFKPAAV